MAGSLLCALEGLIALAIVCLLLWVVWWALTSIAGAMGIGVPAPVLMLLKVIGVLIVVILIVRAIVTGEMCGFLGIRILR